MSELPKVILVLKIFFGNYITDLKMFLIYGIILQAFCYETKFFEAKFVVMFKS